MFRKSNCAGLMLFSIALASGPLLAAQQEAETVSAVQAVSETELLPEITVTGSRIRRDAYTSASPVQIITSERSTLEGLQDPAQILQETAVASSSGQINTLFGNYLVDGGTGVQTLSLRGLGAQRTLVLLNGRRLPPAGAGGTVGPVDLNILPNSIINRIELLKDGASSIYGSDAVAGVANVITKTRLSGGRLGGTYNTAKGGGDQYTLDGTWGWSGDRGGFSLSGEYYNIKQLKLGERPEAACAEDLLYAAQDGMINAIPQYGIPARPVLEGERSDYIDPTTGEYLCWGVPAGYGTFYGGNYAWNPIGTYTAMPPGPGYVGTPISIPGWRRYTLHELYQPTDLELATDLIPYQQRVSFFGQGDYNFSSAAEAYGELMYSQRKSRQEGMRQLFPYVSFESDINPTGAYLYPIVAPLPFKSSQDVQVTRALGGLRGDIGTWRYDAYVSHSRSDAKYNQDVVPYDRLEAATGTYQEQAVWYLQGELIDDGVCGPSAPAGCVPLDEIFTVDALRYGIWSPETLAYITAVDKGRTKYDQTIFEGQITGDLFQLPAGPMAGAFGVVYRKDKINDVPGEFAVNNNSWGFTVSGITRGSDDVKEAYAELELPLLRGLPAVQDLSLNLSGRYSDYKTVGDAFTYKVGLNYKATDLLRFRGTYGTSFRSPALYELYLEDQVGFLGQTSIDPCINWGDPDFPKPQVIQDNCAADGIPPDYDGTGTSSAQIITGGGLGVLRPEESDALTVGVVLTPPGTGFSIAVDYWDIDVRDQVSSSSASIVGACYAQADFTPGEGFCSLFERFGGGPTPYAIDYVDASYRNIPAQRTKGFDANISYERATRFGQLEVESEITRTTYDKAEIYPGEERDYNGLVGEPRWAANMQARIRNGDWTFAWTTNFIGGEDNIGYQDEDGIIATSYSGLSTQVTSVKSIFIHDVSVRYLGNAYEVIFGATNLLSEDPPRASYGVAGMARLGTIPLSSQYYSLIQGTTVFLSVGRSF